MTESDLRSRLEHMEAELNDLYVSLRKLEETINSLNITIALLEQTIRNLKSESDGRAAFTSKITFFLVGGVLSATMAFVLRGGLVQ